MRVPSLFIVTGIVLPVTNRKLANNSRKVIPHFFGYPCFFLGFWGVLSFILFNPCNLMTFCFSSPLIYAAINHKQLETQITCILAQMHNVWCIYLHLPPKLPTCRQIDHALSVWVVNYDHRMVTFFLTWKTLDIQGHLPLKPTIQTPFSAGIWIWMFRGTPLFFAQQDLYVLRRLADVVQPLIRRFTADETVGKPNKKGVKLREIHNKICWLPSPCT